VVGQIDSELIVFWLESWILRMLIGLPVTQESMRQTSVFCPDLPYLRCLTS